MKINSCVDNMLKLQSTSSLPNNGRRSVLLRIIGVSDTEVNVKRSVRKKIIVTNTKSICKSAPMNLKNVCSHLIALNM